MSKDDVGIVVAPYSHNVLLENQTIQVLEVRIKHFAKSEMHSRFKTATICLNYQRLIVTRKSQKEK
jgi:hypothetical protein